MKKQLLKKSLALLLFVYSQITFSAIILVGTFNSNFSTANDLCLKDSVVYVASGSGLGTVNISNASVPVFHPLVSLGGLAVNAVDVTGNYVYAATANSAGGNEFYVLSLTNPHAPTIVAQIDLGAGATVRGLDASGNYVYICTNAATNAFKIVDVTNPVAPVVTGSADIYYPLAVTVSGNYAYVAKTGDPYNNGETYCTVDVTNPSSPARISGFYMNKLISSQSIAQSGGYVYVGNYDAESQDGELSVIDATNPLMQVYNHYYNMPNRPRDLYISGNYLFAGHESGTSYSEFGMYYIGNPLYVLQVDSFNTNCHVWDFAVRNNYAFTIHANCGSGNFSVYNISTVTTEITKPSITVNLPANSSSLSGTVNVTSFATDNLLVRDVQYYVDAVAYGSAVYERSNDSIFALAFNTTLYTNGAHSIYAIARDHAGNTQTSNTINVTINNTSDIIPPAVSILFPYNNETVEHYILIKADASDNRKLASIQFRIDGNAIDSIKKVMPYIARLNTMLFSDGNHALTAVATDSVGNTTTSAAVNITVANNTTPWYNTVTPLNQYYVSPNGIGSGTSAVTPMSITSAIANAVPGDLFWFFGGNYKIGNTTLDKNGTGANPIVWRAMPDSHAVITGKFNIQGNYNWVWGFDITDPTGYSDSVAAPAGGDAVYMRGLGQRAINNVVHDHFTTMSCGNAGEGQAIGSWEILQSGPSHVIYGNILYATPTTPMQRGALVYTQNKFRNNGYKYYLNNVMFDPPKQSCNTNYSGCNFVSGQDCYSFHAYGENGELTGMYIKNNIFYDGRFLVGGKGVPADNEIIKQNYYFNSVIELGFSRPTQVQLLNNFGHKSSLNLLQHWGAGETKFIQTRPSIFTGNEIYKTNGGTIMLMTTSYTGSHPTWAKCTGCATLQFTDMMDNNIYKTPFDGSIAANNGTFSNINLSTWRTTTLSAGNAFEVNSIEAPLPSVARTAVIQNEYEPNRAHIVVYNFGNLDSVAVDISAVSNTGDSYKIKTIKNTFGSPVRSGVVSGTIYVNTAGLEFVVYELFITPAPTSIKNEQSISFLNISPNPASGYININFEQPAVPYTTVRIVDVLGKVMAEDAAISATGTNKININVEEYPAGMYFIQLISQTGSMSRKVIIEK